MTKRALPENRAPGARQEPSSPRTEHRKSEKGSTPPGSAARRQRRTRPLPYKRSAASARRKNCSFGGGFRQNSDLLREGDEAGVVLVGAQERIIKQLSHTRVVRRPGVLQPLEHLLRLLAQGVDLSDLAAAVVGVFVDQFF